MLSATSTTLDTSTGNHASQSSSVSHSPSFLCGSCHISFQNRQEQRVHMKSPWHVYNLKRRIASLPPISLDAFEKIIEKKTDVSEVSADGKSTTSSSSDEEVSDDEGEQSASPFQCLFCTLSFDSDDTGFAKNLEHMRKSHGLFIPDSEMVVDMLSFVGYLATEVRVWHECLYCRVTKSSTLSIQSHMRDKGHCLLNLEKEPELLEFWDSSRRADEDAAATAQEGPADVSATEIQFASGKVIGSKNAAPATKKTTRRTGPTASMMRALLVDSEDAEPSPPPMRPQLASGRQLALREALGITGLSDHQKQVLAIAEKKAQRSEAVARRAREWVYAKGANNQKFDQANNQMKWGKQNHKLQPR